VGPRQTLDHRPRDRSTRGESIRRIAGATIEIGASGIDLVAAGDNLWIPTRSDEVDRRGFPTMKALKRVSASSGAVPTISQPTGRLDVRGLAVRNGTIWIADNTNGVLYRMP
jgi:hypothetical protein